MLVRILLRETVMRVRAVLLTICVLLIMAVALADASGDGFRVPESVWLFVFGLALLGVARVSRQLLTRREHGLLSRRQHE